MTKTTIDIVEKYIERDLENDEMVDKFQNYYDDAEFLFPEEDWNKDIPKFDLSFMETYTIKEEREIAFGRMQPDSPVPEFLITDQAEMQQETAVHGESRNGKKKKRILKKIAVALCVFMCFMFTSSLMAVYIASGSAEAAIARLSELLTKTDDGRVVAIRNSDDSTEIESSYYISNETDIEKMKYVWDELLLPSYIPEGYKFESMYLKKLTDGSFESSLFYKDKELSIEIHQRTMKNDNEDKLVSVYKNDIEYINDHISIFTYDALLNSNSISIYYDNYQLYLTACVDIYELKKIAQNTN